MSASRLGVAILAVRGGSRVVEALDAVAWADARAVLVLHPQAALGSLPADVVVVDSPDALERLDVDRVLLLLESERVERTDVDVLRAANAGAGAGDVFVLPVVQRVLDLEIEAAGRLARVAPPGVALALRPGLGVEFSRAGRAARTVAAPVRHLGGTTLDEMLEQLGCDADVLGAMLDRSRARGSGIVWHPLVAVARTLGGRAASGRLGLGRWLLAVVAGYGVVVAYAKRWEQRRDRRATWVTAS